MANFFQSNIVSDLKSNQKFIHHEKQISTIILPQLGEYRQIFQLILSAVVDFKNCNNFSGMTQQF